jgi:hypothetical protein
VKAVFRSIGAVIGGLAATAITSFAADYLMGLFAPDLLSTGGRNSHPGVLTFILIYSVVFSGLGGYVTARLASRAPMKHVIALAVLQLIGGLTAAIPAAELLPRWFSAAIIVLPVPAILFGGQLCTTKSVSD